MEVVIMLPNMAGAFDKMIASYIFHWKWVQYVGGVVFVFFKQLNNMKVSWRQEDTLCCLVK